MALSWPDLRLRLMKTTYGFPHRAGHGMNPVLGLLFSLYIKWRNK